MALEAKTISLWSMTELFVQAALQRAVDRAYLRIPDARLDPEEARHQLEADAGFTKQRVPARNFWLYQSDARLSIFVNTRTTVVNSDDGVISVFNLADVDELDAIAREHTLLGDINAQYLPSLLPLAFYRSVDLEVLQRSLTKFLGRNRKIEAVKNKRDLREVETSFASAGVFALGAGAFYYRQAQLFERALRHTPRIKLATTFHVTAAIHDAPFDHLTEKAIRRPLWNLARTTLDRPISELAMTLGLIAT